MLACLPRPWLCAIVLLAPLPILAQQPPASPPPPRGAILAEDPLAHARELAAAEKAFARMAQEKGGPPPAFRACFAVDGIIFAPGPRPVREVYDEPEGAPPDHRLEWTPEWVMASADGTLGFSTGPAELTLLDAKGTPKGAPRPNWFFSIWRANKPGQWRVAFDMGVPTPPHGETLGRIPCRMTALERVPAEAGAPALEEAERALNQAARESGLGPAFGEWMREDSPAAGDNRTRWYREGAPPVDGRRGIVEAADREGGRPSFATAATGAAGSQDLGWSHGTFTGERDGRPTRGWYLRAWIREGQPARWRLAAQMTKAEPRSP